LLFVAVFYAILYRIIVCGTATGRVGLVLFPGVNLFADDYADSDDYCRGMVMYVIRLDSGQNAVCKYDEREVVAIRCNWL